jgi:N-acetyl-anhydromuramyl-L-alanine amidase AmpD
MIKVVVLVGLLLISGCSSASEENIQEVDAPEEIVEQDKELEGIIDSLLPIENSKPRIGTISHLVIHFISNATNNPQDPYSIKAINSIFIDYGVSTHYMIGREGEIYRLVPEDRIAIHAGPGFLPGFPFYDNILNGYSIGIELLAIGTREEMLPIMPGETYDSIDPSLIGYTDAQYESLNKLVDNILERNPSILRSRRHVIGHDEYAPDRKTDPGSLFDWSRIGF